MDIFIMLVIVMGQLLSQVLLWSLAATLSIITFLVKFGIRHLNRTSRLARISPGEITASDWVFTWSILIFVKTDSPLWASFWPISLISYCILPHEVFQSFGAITAHFILNLNKRRIKIID